MSVGRIVIAGTQSGSGKTTIATGVIAALAARRRVQPFKCGPDYIDPTYHTRAAGRPSRNLDTWMLPEAAVLELFERACQGADLAIIEGVMGLFDGRTGERDAGSTAHVATLLGAPVVLVVDAARVARSAAALVHGFDRFDPHLRLAGVILNRIGSDRHYAAVAGPIEQEAGVPVLGYLPRRPELELPERYLGLIPTTEGPVANDYFERLRLACERTIDLARLEAIAESAPALSRSESSTSGSSHQPGLLLPGAISPSLFPAVTIEPSVRIAVARDAAFGFYYEDNLDLLRAWGAEIVEFSPLEHERLPERTSAVYLGGGFPELFAVRLAANRGMHRSIRQAAAAGMPIYAECGGLMYLAETLTDRDGETHAMLGLVPARCSIRDARLSLGYRELRTTRSNLLLAAGQYVRAHEFHYSMTEQPPAEDEAAYAIDPDGRREGYAHGSVLASYMHLHFGGSAALAPRLVDAAKIWRAHRPA